MIKEVRLKCDYCEKKRKPSNFTHISYKGHRSIMCDKCFRNKNVIIEELFENED